MKHDRLCPYEDFTDWLECEDCEGFARVREDERERYAMKWQAEQEEIHVLGLNLAYRKGLDAARDAVAALLAYESPMGPLVRVKAALAVIDALKENA